MSVAPSSGWRKIAASLASMRLMAIIACVAGVGFAVAIHAAFHREGFLFPERVAFGDRAMTALTFRARFQMRAVTEPDPGGVLINPNPRDGGFVLMIFGEFLDRGFVRRDLRMTGHTFRRRRKGHLFAGVGIDVAALAFQPLRDVQLVAERQRLLRRFWRLRQNSDSDGDCRQDNFDDVTHYFPASGLASPSLKPMAHLSASKYIFWIYGKANAITVSALDGSAMKPPPVAVITTYCFPSLPM